MNDITGRQKKEEMKGSGSDLGWQGLVCASVWEETGKCPAFKLNASITSISK